MVEDPERAMDERSSEALHIVRAWLVSTGAPYHVVQAFKDLRVCDNRAGWKKGCDAATEQAKGLIEAEIKRKARR